VQPNQVRERKTGTVEKFWNKGNKKLQMLKRTQIKSMKKTEAGARRRDLQKGCYGVIIAGKRRERLGRG
jgi:hypothetical protein